jgi:hypothetical protein
MKFFMLSNGGLWAKTTVDENNIVSNKSRVIGLDRFIV